MRHAVAGYKLNRDTEHRRAMFRNLAAAVFQHGQITTTLPKAKAVRPFVEKLVTLARKGDLASRRRAIALLRDRELVHVVKEGREERVEARTLIQKLFDEIGPRYTDRPGGYTRIVKLSRHRIGDGADLVVLQLVGEEEEGAPRVGGQYSRRRQKQDNRTAFAAKLRKSRSGRGGAASGEEEATGEAVAAGTETAESEPVAAEEQGASPGAPGEAEAQAAESSQKKEPGSAEASAGDSAEVKGEKSEPAEDEKKQD